eukprot:CAMPEP_0177676972 /NCGR_PEP_ID=MMETSP0447-20121125/28113_1 /TAXON_ID=0 /ORGANISM="Stygamoeba regulata, Strain BSH-02190019" /LENGTH=211 /DNA_ID=CAMNT_0019185649 /DNA_START=117 /DNA_END=750 /DNA_ORIENTATION=-
MRQRNSKRKLSEEEAVQGDLAQEALPESPADTNAGGDGVYATVGFKLLPSTISARRKCCDVEEEALDPERVEWARRMRKLFTPPDMLTGDGLINHDYFKPDLAAAQGGTADELKDGAEGNEKQAEPDEDSEAQAQPKEEAQAAQIPMEADFSLTCPPPAAKPRCCVKATPVTSPACRSTVGLHRRTMASMHGFIRVFAHTSFTSRARLHLE